MAEVCEVGISIKEMMDVHLRPATGTNDELDLALLEETLAGTGWLGLSDPVSYPELLADKLTGLPEGDYLPAVRAIAAVRAGYLIHYAEVSSGNDQQRRLIAGDNLYAIGLTLIQGLGMPTAVEVLARLIDASAVVMGVAEDSFLMTEDEDSHGITVRTSVAWQSAVYEMAALILGLSMPGNIIARAGFLAGVAEGARLQGLKRLGRYANDEINAVAGSLAEPVAGWLKGERWAEA